MPIRRMAAVAIACALACSGPTSRLLVVIESDYDIPGELAGVRVTVRSFDDEGAALGAAQSDVFRFDAGDRLPRSFALATRRSPPGRAEVIAEALSSSDAVLVRRRVLAPFVLGRTMALTIALERACAPIACERAGESCVDGACASDVLSPSDLRPVGEMGAEFVDGGRIDAGPPDGGCVGAVLDGGSCDLFTAVYSGPTSEHTCATTTSGALYCWGRDEYGQLGDRTSGLANRRALPTRVEGISSVVDLAAGQAHTCAIAGGGRGVVCWGGNWQGQLGNGDLTAAPALDPVGAMLPRGILSQVAAGGLYTCALLTSGLYCWGDRNEGEVDGVIVRGDPQELPISVLSGVSQVSAGGAHTCARLGGVARCWGRNAWGKLGDGTTTGTGPVDVPALTDAAEIAAGGAFTCVRHEAGTVSCGGGMDFGAGVLRIEGLDLASIVDAQRIEAGGSHACVLTADHRVMCWGRNVEGQLGDGDETMHGPIAAAGIDDAMRIAVGGFHTCALRSDMTVWCWGGNASGQLGDGTTEDRRTPVRVARPAP